LLLWSITHYFAAIAVKKCIKRQVIPTNVGIIESLRGSAFRLAQAAKQRSLGHSMPPSCSTSLLLLQVPFKSMINNSCQGGSLVAAILTGDAALLGAALDSDVIIEPVRAPLIPGMPAVKEAAKKAGGLQLHGLQTE
jgi:hypothetical protein